ncbi:hypothetical protein AZE42_06082 [Rhizopogon vesiculosus]|uniref:Uncharacterized protein n=1 Tax=Rhizopogon vesiculosus TaxID=180088 RepID=A0A1J8QIJ4_9AGAM|nr:hypothetical protein AZE42_06082 [Rhizopogon vesiculosus]
MGRPLYSKAFSTEPVVREPEPSCPYEKWSYVNAFDPDSDEFFENDQAVYEAFVDHVAAEQSEEEDDVEESDMVVIRMGNASPISSEDSLSDRDSPMAVGADDPAQYIAEVYRRRRAGVEAPARVNLATRGIPGDLQSDTPVVGEAPVESVVITSSRDNVETPVQQPTSHLAPPSSAPIPVPRPHRSASVEDFTIPSFYHQSSPMTPSRHSAFSRFSPSPPLTVSPRIYTWASRRPTYPSTSTSPFTNTNARLSHAHLSPALVRVHGLMT